MFGDNYLVTTTTQVSAIKNIPSKWDSPEICEATIKEGDVLVESYGGLVFLEGGTKYAYVEKIHDGILELKEKGFRNLDGDGQGFFPNPQEIENYNNFLQQKNM